MQDCSKIDIPKRMLTYVHLNRYDVEGIKKYPVSYIHRGIKYHFELSGNILIQTLTFTNPMKSTMQDSVYMFYPVLEYNDLHWCSMLPSVDIDINNRREITSIVLYYQQRIGVPTNPEGNQVLYIVKLPYSFSRWTQLSSARENYLHRWITNRHDTSLGSDIEREINSLSIGVNIQSTSSLCICHMCRSGVINTDYINIELPQDRDRLFDTCIVCKQISRLCDDEDELFHEDYE